MQLDRKSFFVLIVINIVISETSLCNLKTASGFDHLQKRCSHEFAARNFYIEIIKIVVLLRRLRCRDCIASTLFVYTTSWISSLRHRTCYFFRHLGRNCRNVPETGSNEDSAATTFVRTTNPLRACSIY